LLPETTAGSSAARKRALAPLDGAVKTTVAPGTAFPNASLTFTRQQGGKRHAHIRCLAGASSGRDSCSGGWRFADRLDGLQR